tara:strand:+ start:256 stop:1323 length:1068 start_codon:yes stop_codon:yes gene_type:complete
MRDLDHLEADARAMVSDLPPIVRGSDFMDDVEVVEPAQLVDGMLHKGSMLIIGGGSKGRKTWAFMHLAVCVSEGRDWWGWHCNQGRVLYLNFELQPFAMQKRMKMLRHYYQTHHEPVTCDQFDVWNLRGKSRAIEELAGPLKEAIKGYDLVIFDPLYKMLGDRSENDAGEMASLMNELEQIAVECDVSIVIGAHYRKGNVADGGKMFDKISGSGVLARHPDSILTMTDLDSQVDDNGEEQECCVIEPVLRNFPPRGKFGLYWDCPCFETAEWVNIEKVKGGGASVKKFFVEDLKGMFKSDGAITYTEAYKKVMKELGCGDRTAKKLVGEAKDLKILQESVLEEVDSRGQRRLVQT